MTIEDEKNICDDDSMHSTLIDEIELKATNCYGIHRNNSVRTMIRIYGYCQHDGLVSAYKALFQDELFYSMPIFVASVTMFVDIGVCICLILVVFCIYYVQKKKRNNSCNVGEIESKNIEKKLKNLQNDGKKLNGLTSIADVLKSLMFIVILEIKNMFTIWFSIAVMIKYNENMLKNTFIQTKIINSECEYVSFLILLLFVLIDVILQLFWCGKFIFSPFKFCLIYEVYKEWIVTRIIFIGVYVYFFFIMMTICFTQYFIPQHSDVRGFSSSFQYFFGYLSILALMFIQVIQSLNYDGIGSVAFTRQLKYFKRFPYIKIRWIDLFFKSPHAIISDVVNSLNLIKSKKDIKEKENTVAYRHCKFYHIEKLEDSEIELMKEFLLNPDIKEGVLYSDILLYSPPITKKWIINLCCIGIKVKKVMQDDKDLEDVVMEKIDKLDKEKFSEEYEKVSKEVDINEIKEENSEVKVEC